MTATMSQTSLFFAGLFGLDDMIPPYACVKKVQLKFIENMQAQVYIFSFGATRIFHEK